MSRESLSGADMTRRDCMLWIGRAVALGCALEACGHDALAGDKDKKKDNDKRSDAPIANLMSVPVGKAFESKGDYILTRTEHGVAALSVFCTHRHNRLQFENGTITCPVHGSEFDFDGKPLTGPANRPLSWFAVQINEDGDIRVDASKQVPQGTYAVLPSWARKP